MAGPALLLFAAYANIKGSFSSPINALAHHGTDTYGPNGSTRSL
jgi:hypothetical protein